jgi:hypothetical protein
VGARVALNVARVGFAAVAAVAMTYQFAEGTANDSRFAAANFFSFFTIQSNVLAAAMLVLAALVRTRERTPLFDAVRGAVTLYISTTGVVFAILLAGLQEELQTTIPWVDFVVHKLIPIVLVADWLIEPPRNRLPALLAGAWLAYPLAWFVYTLVRGADVGWYPYPFVDVGEHGYGRVLFNTVLLLFGFAAAAVAFVLFGNRRARAHEASASLASGTASS